MYYSQTLYNVQIRQTPVRISRYLCRELNLIVAASSLFCFRPSTSAYSHSNANGNANGDANGDDDDEINDDVEMAELGRGRGVTSHTWLVLLTLIFTMKRKHSIQCIIKVEQFH